MKTHLRAAPTLPLRSLLMRLLLFVASFAALAFTVMTATREASAESVTLPDRLRLGEPVSTRDCLNDAELRAL